jgi:hypothetical protein
MGDFIRSGPLRSTADRRKWDRMKRSIMAALVAVTAFSTLFVVTGAAGPAGAATGTGCPGSKVLGSIPTASNVAAGFSNSGTTSTYTFSSLTDENPVGGVPGLVKYCVYPTPKTPPSNITVTAEGANGADWVSAKSSNNFAFARPGGNKTNIPLDGTTTAMGTATWSVLPTNQKIILHIADPTVCANLYGSGASATCFVKPSTGPICNLGDTTVAYNAMPFDVVNCLNPAIGFEAQSASEFGDEVGLAGTARKLVSLEAGVVEGVVHELRLSDGRPLVRRRVRHDTRGNVHARHHGEHLQPERSREPHRLGDRESDPSVPSVR